MTMTPLAPRIPYIAVPVASFTTWIEAMSYGEMPDKAPFGPGSIAMPSITYSGIWPPLGGAPRSLTEIPPSGDLETHTPGYFAASWSSIDMVGLRLKSSAVTAVPDEGGAIGSTSPTGDVLGGAQARTSPRANDLIIGEI